MICIQSIKGDIVQEIGKRSKFDELSKIFKFSLFRSPSFVVICISSFFQSIGWFVPFIYLAGIDDTFVHFTNLISLMTNGTIDDAIFFVAHAVDIGATKESASFLISIVGISSMIGRLINGWLADRPKVFKSIEFNKTGF